MILGFYLVVPVRGGGVMSVCLYVILCVGSGLILPAINILAGFYFFSIVNMVVMRRRRRFRRGRVKQFLVHAYQNNTNTQSTISAEILKLAENRPCRIRWARLRFSSIEPRFVKLVLVSPGGAMIRTSSMFMSHNPIGTIFLRPFRGNEFGNYKGKQGVIDIYSNGLVRYALSVCMDYSYPIANTPERGTLGVPVGDFPRPNLKSIESFVEDNTIQEEEKEIRT